MSVRTQCPRCKQALAVPNKLAGSYANCPRCQGRFWISKDAPTDSSISDSVSMSGSTLTLTQVPAGATAPPVAAPPQVIAPAVATAATAAPPAPPSSRTYFPSVTPLAPVPLPDTSSSSSAPPTPPPQARKVARLVTADAAPSSLKIAADGQLPNLQLQDAEKKDKGQGKSRSIPPLVLVAAWFLSVLLTTAVLLFTASGDSDSVSPQKAEAMRQIEEQYFGDPARGPLLPYQQLLRQARQAHARGDYKSERQHYRQVLDLLRVESHVSSARGGLEKGVTGSRENDKELENKIMTVLGE